MVIKTPWIQRERIDLAIGKIVFLVFTVLALFYVSKISGIFVEPQWEHVDAVTADNTVAKVTYDIVFDKYMPDKCENGIYVSDGETAIPFEIIESNYSGGMCFSATIQFDNSIYGVNEETAESESEQAAEQQPGASATEEVSVTVPGEPAQTPQKVKGITEIYESSERTTITGQATELSEFKTYYIFYGAVTGTPAPPFKKSKQISEQNQQEVVESPEESIIQEVTETIPQQPVEEIITNITTNITSNETNATLPEFSGHTFSGNGFSGQFKNKTSTEDMVHVEFRQGTSLNFGISSINGNNPIVVNATSKDGKIIYENILHNLSLEYYSTTDSLKETFVLYENPSATEDFIVSELLSFVGINEFSLYSNSEISYGSKKESVTLSSLAEPQTSSDMKFKSAALGKPASKILIENVGKTIDAVETTQDIDMSSAAGTVFYIPAGKAFDSNNASTDITYRMSKQNDKIKLDIIVDSAWLLDKARVYPVYIDPSITTFQSRTSEIGWINDQQLGYQIQAFPAFYNTAGDFVVTWINYTGTDGVTNALKAKRFDSFSTVNETAEYDFTECNEKRIPEIYTGIGNVNQIYITSTAASEAGGEILSVYTNGSDGAGTGNDAYMTWARPGDVSETISGETCTNGGGAAARPTMRMSETTSGNQAIAYAAASTDGDRYGACWQNYMGAYPNYEIIFKLWNGTETGSNYQNHQIKPSSNNNCGTFCTGNESSASGQASADRDLTCVMDFQVNSTNNFVICWVQYDGTRYNGICRRFNNTGGAMAAAFGYESTATSVRASDVVWLDDERFVVAYTELSANPAVKFSIYYANGTAIAADQVVNNSANIHYWPSVARLENGNFIYVYQANTSIANSFDIFGAIYYKNGTLASSASHFIVNENMTNAQTNPRVESRNGTNEYVVTWQSQNDSSWDGVRMRLFGSKAPSISTLLINSTSGTNLTTENVTVYANSTDPDSDYIFHTFNWKENGIPIAVGLWPFDSNSDKSVKDYAEKGNDCYLGDGAGNYAPTWTEDGKLGGAYTFSSSANNYVTITDRDSMDTGQELTISMWVNFSSVGSTYDTWFSRGPQGATGFIWFMLNGNNMYYQYSNGAGAVGVETSAQTWTLGQWYHLAVTSSNITKRVLFYKDGELVGNLSIATVIVPVISGDTYLGTYAGNPTASTYRFMGAMDDVRFYNQAITPEQIKQIYYEGSELGKWTFDKNEIALNSSIRDVSGNSYDGTCAYCPVWTSSGQLGGAYTFDGGDSVNFTAITLKDNFTIAFWDKTINSNGKAMPFGGSSSSYGYVWEANTTHIGISNDGETKNARIYYQPSLDTNWKHIVISVNNGNVSVYKNGAYTGSQVMATPFTITASRIGWAYHINYAFNGSIDQVRLYNYSINADQVQQLYKEGLYGYSSTIVSQETGIRDNWSATVTPNDLFLDGASVTSPNMTIQPGIDGCMDLTFANSVYPLVNNLSRAVDGRQGCLVVENNNITIDCDGYTIDASNMSGIFAQGRTNITVKNCAITEGFPAVSFFNTTNSWINDSNLTGSLFYVSTASDSTGNIMRNVKLNSSYANMSYYGEFTMQPVSNTLPYYHEVGDLVDIASTSVFSKAYSYNSYDYGYDIKQAYDGGYIVVGETAGPDDDVYLLKLDNSGAKQWEKTFNSTAAGGMTDDSGRSVVATSDGGYVILGYLNISGHFHDFWLFKTDSSGGIVWSKTFHRSTVVAEFDDYGMSLSKTSDGGYILAGYSASAIETSVWLIKTDSSGNEAWNKSFTSAGGWKGYSVKQTLDGNYIIAGNGSNDFVLIKTDSSGTLLWNKTYNNGSDAAYSVVETSDGGYMLAGTNNSDVWILKTDSSGTPVWNKTYGGANFDAAYSIIKTNDDNYVIAGRYSSGLMTYVMWLLKIDSSGNQIWSSTFSGSYAIANAAVETMNGGYAVTGSGGAGIGASDVQAYHRNYIGTAAVYSNLWAYYNVTYSPSTILTSESNIQMYKQNSSGWSNPLQFSATNGTDTTKDVVWANITAIGSEFGPAEPGIVACTNLTNANTVYDVILNMVGNQSHSVCIDIQADNVTLDCEWHSLTGNVAASTTGIYALTRDNVTINNCNVFNYSSGVKLVYTNDSIVTNNLMQNHTTNGHLILLSYSNNNTVTNNTIRYSWYSGMHLDNSDNNTVFNNTMEYCGSNDWSSLTLDLSDLNNLSANIIRYAPLKATFIRDSDNNTFTNNTILSSVYGLYLTQDSDFNTFIGNNVTRSTSWDFYSSGSTANNNIITNMSTNVTNSSFTYDGGISLNTSNAPAGGDPSGYINIGKYLSLANNTAGAWMYINITYLDSDWTGLNESSLRIFKNSSNTWSQNINLTGTRISNVSITSNYVYANISNFSSVFAPMGARYAAPSTSAPTVDPTTAYKTDNLYCNATSNSTYYTSLTAYWRLYNKTIPYLSGTISVTNGTSTNITVLLSGNLTKGDNWTCEVIPNDGYLNGSAVNSTQRYINNTAPPAFTNIVLNTTTLLNITTENLTLYFTTGTDADGDSITNISDWRINGTSMAVVNYAFNSNVSSTASGAIRDYSTFQNNGTIVVNPRWNSSGKVGGGYTFDGTLDDYISVPALSSITTGTPFTICAWVYPTSTANYRTILGYDGTHRLLIDNSGTMLSQQNGNFFSATGAVANNNWNYVVYWTNGLVERWYINGSLSGTESAQTQAEWNAASKIGQYDLANYPFNGTIDEMQIYNTSLSPEQIASNYQEGLARHSIQKTVSQQLSKYQNWTVALTPNDGQNDGATASSNYLFIRVAAATTTTPTIDPTPAYKTSTLYCNATLKDFVQTSMTAYWKWYKNGITNISGTKSSVSNNTYTNITTLTSGNITKGDVWICEVTPYNAELNGTAANSTGKTISDTASTFTSFSVNTAERNLSAKYSANVTDADTISGCMIESNNSGSFANTSFTLLSGTSTWCNITITNNNTNNTNVTWYVWINDTGNIWTRSSLQSFITNNTIPTHYTPYAGEHLRLSADMVSYWRLDGNAYDDTYSNNGTVTGATATYEGRVGRAYSFDGSSQYISISNPSAFSFSGTKNMTIAAWIKPKTQSGDAMIVSKFNGGVRGEYYIGINASNFVIVDREAAPWSMASTGPISTNAWHHIVYSYNGTHSIIYIDGTFNKALAFGSVSADTTTPLYIGARLTSGSPSNFFNGTIDEVVVYNRALSSTAVQELYNTTSGVNNSYSESDLGCSMNSSADNNFDTIIPVYNWYLNNTPYSQLYLPFNNNVSVITTKAVRDYTPYQNNGTLGGGTTAYAPTWTTSGKTGGAYSFDGSNDYISVADSSSLDIQNAITISGWFYPMSNPVGYAAHIITKWSGTADANYVMYYFGTTSGEDRSVGFYGNAGGSWQSLSTHYPLPLNAWTHVAWTYTSTGGGILYINGTPQSATGTGSGVLTTNNVQLLIGGDAAPYFDGILDEVHIYNRSLSAEEIVEQYRENYDFISDSQTTKYDNWTCEVTLTDGYDDAAAKNASSLVLTDDPCYITTAVTRTSNLVCDYDLIITSAGSLNASTYSITVGHNLTLIGNLTMGAGQINVTNDTIISSTGLFNGGTGNHTMGSLTVSASGNISGNGDRINLTNKNPWGYAVDIDGIINNNTDLLISTPSNVLVDIVATSGYMRNLEINMGSGNIWYSASGGATTHRIDGNLVMTSGTYNENYASDSIYVGGNMTIASGAVFGRSSWAGTGTFNSITISSGGTYYATSGVTNINDYISISGTYTYNSGSVNISGTNCKFASASGLKLQKLTSQPADTGLYKNLTYYVNITNLTATGGFGSSYFNITYNDADSTINESSLQMLSHSGLAWEEWLKTGVQNSGVSTTGNYVWANITSFNRIFAPMEMNSSMSSCKDLSDSNYAYTMTAGATGLQINKTMCIDIKADNVTFDCNYNTITGLGNGTGVNIYNHTGILFKNCFINNYSVGLRMLNTTNSNFTNIAINNSIAYDFVEADSSTGNIATNITFNRTSTNFTYDGEYYLNSTTDPGNRASNLYALDSFVNASDFLGLNKSSSTTEGMSIIQTQDGGYLIGGNGMEMLKVDYLGNQQWFYDYVGGSCESWDAAQTSEGGYIEVGAQPHPSEAQSTNVYLVKTNSTGQSTWSHEYVRNDVQHAYSVDPTTDGGYYLVGEDYSSNFGDVYVIKTNSTGDIQWEKWYDGGGTPQIFADAGRDGEQTRDGGYIITGYKLTSLTTQVLWLIKTDSSGNSQWNKTFGTGDDSAGYSVQQTSDNGYIVSGYINSWWGTLYVLKTDSNGNKQWDATFGSGVGLTVRQTNDGGYIVVGTKSNDVILIKLDPNGNQQWNKTFDLGYTEYGYSVKQTYDGGYAITGFTTNISTSNLWLIKTNSEGLITNTAGWLMLNETYNASKIVSSEDYTYLYKYNGSWNAPDKFSSTSGRSTAGDYVWANITTFGSTFAPLEEKQTTQTTTTPTIDPTTAYATSTLYCNATISASDSLSPTAYWTWYKNGVTNTSGSTSVTNGTNANITTISSGLVKGDSWICQVTPNGGTNNGTAVNSSARTISNSVPVVSSASVDPSTINLVACGNVTVYCSATVADSDRYTDMSSGSAVMYNSDVTTYGCTANNTNCYQTSSCALTGCAGTSCTLNCTVSNVRYYAKGGNWKCNMTVTDSSSASGSAEANAIINNLTSISISPTINFGAVSTNVYSNNISDNIQNCGNVDLDTQHNGTNMVCTSNQIGVTNISYSASQASGYVALNSTAMRLDINIITPINDTSSNKTNWWRLFVPRGVSDTCTGTATFIAVSNI